MKTSHDTILNLETRFWQSMVDKDPETAMTMIHEKCLITGPMGTMQVGPKKYGEMTREGTWELDRFEFSDVNVVCPNDETAVIAYKVHQTGSMKDQPMDLNCADSSTWVRDGSAWKVVLHTESIIEQPKGKPH
jgi:hypothetical protein